MKRKRFIKLCMANGWSRNYARLWADNLDKGESYQHLWDWDGPTSTLREDLHREMIRLLDERTGGVLSMVSRMSPYMGAFSYLGGY